MTNGQIYKKTLVFSIRRLIYDLLALVFLAAACAAGFFIAEKVANRGLIGLVIGLIAGAIVIAIVFRYISYTYKAGQIAMMTKAITEGELPDNVLAEGKKTAKERFITVAAFFAITGVIKGLFSEIGNGIASVGKKVGGDTGETVGNVISSVIQTIISYLSDCCLGWVFFRAGQKAFNATCEGAVIFFKHGKTFLKNMGRVFGIGLVSLIAIGAPFFGIFYLIFTRFPAAFQRLAAEITEAAERLETSIPAILQDPKTLVIVCAALAALMIWSFIHSNFIRPFVLVGVLRNFLQSGMADIPSEDTFSILESKSKKFAKYRQKYADV